MKSREKYNGLLSLHSMRLHYEAKYELCQLGVVTWKLLIEDLGKEEN
jgi:hypothetical protein